MSLVRNCRRVPRYAWSIRLVLLAGLLSGAEAALPLIREVVDVPRDWLTPRRYESGEASRNGRICKQGSQLTRKHLYEAATTLLTRNLRF